MTKIKKFEIKDTVSLKEWKPKGIWSTFKKGLDEGYGGVQEAIKEAYAVTTSTIDENFAKEHAFGLHHEVTEAGEVVLNKFALAKAVADLSANTTLTEEQKAEARAHLLRHYEELEEDPPASLVEGEMSILEATIEGMKPADIPVAPGVDLEAIKAGDDDPLEVVVSVPESKSKRGWFYAGESLQDIVNFVNAETLSGFLGHQKPDNVDTEFPTPVTHWVGAKWENGKAYFRGVVDKVAPDLKRWIRSKRVTQVSIFGIPTLKNVAGEVHVVGYKPLSIDWTPLHRAGMPSEVVAVGEMFEIPMLKDTDGSFESFREVMDTVVRNRFKTNENWVWLQRIFDDHVIVQLEAKDQSWKLYSVPYIVEDGEVVLGHDMTEVVEKRTFVPTGETSTEGAENMNIKEMLAAIRSAMAKGETDLEKVLGEIGLTKEQVVEQFAGEQIAKFKTGAEFGAKLSTTLGFTEETDTKDALKVAGEMAEVWKALGFDKDKPERPAEIVGEMVNAIETQAKEAHAKLIEETIQEKVTGEQAQVVVTKMLNVADGATKEEIVGEIDNILADEAIKTILGKNFVEPSVPRGGSTEGAPKHLVQRTASI